MQQGYLPESAIDTALIRLFTARIRLGMFDPPSMVPYDRIPESELDSPAHRQLALHLAEESMVLLKNDGVLPLRSVKRIAVIGPLADQTAVLLGNYNGIPDAHRVPARGNESRIPASQDHLRPRNAIPFQSGHPGADLGAHHSGRQAWPAG